MLRTFNYTNRRKILQEEAKFTLEQGKNGYPFFIAEFKLNTDGIPPDAKVYVKAGYKETIQRFDYGKISNITPPEDTYLNELDLSGTISFEIVIVNETAKHSLILASGSGFRHDKRNEDGRSSLLAVKAHPMEGLCWKIDFEDADLPELVVNNKIPNAIEKVRTDPVFQALILPSAMQQILTKYLLSDDSDPDSEAVKRWLVFANMFSDDDPSDMDNYEKHRWIENVIQEFAQKFDFSERLIDVYKDEE